MFRKVQLEVYNAIGQEPWYTHGALRSVYLAGKAVPRPQAAISPAALAFRIAKDTNNPAALRAFARRYKGTVFADMALAMAETADKQSVATIAPPKPPAAIDRRQPGTTFKDCDVCPEMVVVPAGSFMMGSPADEEGRSEDEGPQRPRNAVSSIRGWQIRDLTWSVRAVCWCNRS